MRYTLRDYQSDSINKLRQAYRQGFRAPLLTSPTGSGKTVMFANITESAARLGNSVIILVHRQELLRQTSESLFEIGVPHGMIAPGFTPTRDIVQVASVQTFVRRLNSGFKPKLIVVDECHHAVAGSWAKVLNNFPDAKLLGVTATPQRLDGRGLGISAGGFFDSLIIGPTVSELVNLGYLSQPVVFAPPVGADFTGVKKRFGDFIQAEVAERMDKPTITGCAVEHYRRICPGAPAIAFCGSVKHAEHVAERFNASGIPAVSIDGTMSDIERKDSISGLANGKYLVLASCEIVSEGTDIPVVTAAILLRPTYSMGLYLQQCGRALRIHPKKTRSIILDHVGNTFRHGFPDDEREWSLEGIIRRGKKSDTEAPINVVQCMKCYLVFQRAQGKCPYCGGEVPASEREIEQVDGELQEITDMEKRRIKFDRVREQSEAQTLDDLIALGKRRGYKPGWALAVWRVRQAKRTARTVEHEPEFAFN